MRTSRLALGSHPDAPKPHLYLSICIVWFLTVAWFHPRMWSLLELAHTPLAKAALIYFVVFTYIAWLFALYNLWIIIFALIYRQRYRESYLHHPPLPHNPPAVALLYTTYNDFVQASVESCLGQDYPNFTVYILDDSTDPHYQALINQFAALHPEQVRVVRRPDRQGFKAGNLNHALSRIEEPLFALADADEILPPDFLSRLVPRLLAQPNCGFIQANHHYNPADQGGLSRAMGIGVDIHWRWYQPLRNRYGFVMLLGHGALVRRRCWEEAGGFPQLVSEDLAFAIAAREKGWRGQFAEDVICHESFPQDMRAFRIRHMKWTRGTCEFFYRKLGFLLRARNIPLVEKLDILFPTLGLPLALLFFVYLIDSNLILTQILGQVKQIELGLGGLELSIPALSMEGAFSRISGPDFFLVTLVCILAPTLCFILEMGRKPLELYRFISASTVVNGALAPLSFLGVLLFLLTRQAMFHVTADRGRQHPTPSAVASLRQFLAGSHPDHWAVRTFEMSCGAIFAALSLSMFNLPFFGLALAFGLQALLHQIAWDDPLVRRLIHLPMLLIVSGLALSTIAILLT